MSEYGRYGSPSHKKVTALMEFLGFQSESTGGNCRAFFKNVGKHEMYLTDGDAGEPTSMSENCHLSFQYNDADGDYTEIWGRSFRSVTAFVRWYQDLKRGTTPRHGHQSPEANGWEREA